MNKNNKKIVFVVLVVLIVLGVGTFLALTLFKDGNYANIKEYTPQEEITEAQLRKTIISLFFKSGEKEELVTEARLIDAKLLLNDPYTLLLTMLIQGPENSNNKALLPSNTIINKVELKEDVLEVDLSEAFIKEFEGDDAQKKLAIESMLKTLTQLNEVNKMRILINGETNKGFENSEVSFSETFSR